MEGIVLGSGTGIPSLKRNAPGYYLEAAGLSLLIDCGSSTLRQLLRAKKRFEALDGIFITHTHADHIGDLTPLVHALRLPGLERKKPLRLFGPPGFTQFFEKIVVPVAEPPTHFPFHVTDAEAQWQWNGLTIQTGPTRHSSRFKSVAYRFQKDKKSIVFSGDCDYDQGIIDLAQGADLLILDCSTMDAGKVQGHLSAGLAGLVATKAGVKKLIPTHFYPIPGPKSQRARECSLHFSGPVQLAEDFMTFSV